MKASLKLKLKQLLGAQTISYEKNTFIPEFFEEWNVYIYIFLRYDHKAQDQKWTSEVKESSGNPTLTVGFIRTPTLVVETLESTSKPAALEERPTKRSWNHWYKETIMEDNIFQNPQFKPPHSERTLRLTELPVYVEILKIKLKFNESLKEADLLTTNCFSSKWNILYFVFSIDGRRGGIFSGDGTVFLWVLSLRLTLS